MVGSLDPAVSESIHSQGKKPVVEADPSSLRENRAAEHQAELARGDADCERREASKGLSRTRS